MTLKHLNMPILPWLTYTQSLTKKLRALSGDARLDVLDQRWERSDQWDSDVLKLASQDVMHREILMWAFDARCWYARTIIPETTFKMNSSLFARLKTESLGQLIFTGPDIQRVSLIHYEINPESIEYQWLTPLMHRNAASLWVRLSEFTVHKQQSFFLIEILLPGLSRYLS